MAKPKYAISASPKGPQAARLRQRKHELLRHFAFPQDLLPGSLTESTTRCGKPTCHCAHPDDPGHASWTLTFMKDGRRRVERIPKAWAEQVRERVRAGREFQDAVRDLLTTNAELLVLARKQKLQQP